MSGTSSTVEIDDTGRLWVRLRGRLEIDEIDRLSDDLLPRLEKIGTGAKLIIDMHELHSVSTKARLRLRELQRGIAIHQARTAFVADRPRFRGIGLFVAHTSGDRNARSFHRLAQAEAWLMATEGRIESLVAWRARYFRGDKPRSPERRSSEDLHMQVTKLRESSGDGEEDPP